MFSVSGIGEGLNTKLTCFILCAIISVVTPQLVVNSTIGDGDVVCPRQVITFTCETRGSRALVWTSDEYIGRGSQLEFTEFNSLDLTRTSPDVVATFITNTNIDGTIVLVSQLELTVSTAFPHSSITCIHVQGGSRNTTNFQLLGDPEMPQRSILAEQRRHTIVNDSCMLHLAWNSPVNYSLEYLSGYMINIDGANKANKTDNLDASFNLFALLLYCKNYSVSLQAINICDRVSNSTPTVIVAPENFFFSQVTPNPTADTGGSPESSESTAEDSLPSIILGVILGVSIVIFGGIIAGLAIALWRANNKHKNQNVSKQAELQERS